MELRDHDKIIEYLTPFLLKEHLPTDNEFIERLSLAYIEASRKLVLFRRDRALAKLSQEKLDGVEYLRTKER